MRDIKEALRLHSMYCAGCSEYSYHGGAWKDPTGPRLRTSETYGNEGFDSPPPPSTHEEEYYWDPTDGPNPECGNAECMDIGKHDHTFLHTHTKECYDC